MPMIYRTKKLVTLIDNETASLEDILKYNYDYYSKHGKIDYNQSIEASYLQGRIDALKALKRHIKSK